MMYLRNCQTLAVEAGSAQISGSSTQTFRIQLLRRTQDGGTVAVTGADQEVDEIVIAIKLAEELQVTIDAKKVANGEDLVTAIKASAEGVGLGAHVAVDKMFKRNGLMLNLTTEIQKVIDARKQEDEPLRVSDFAAFLTTAEEVGRQTLPGAEVHSRHPIESDRATHHPSIATLEM